MSQLLLFPDPRPLVERLGADFFRQAPECPGVYLMRDSTAAILYVGKAKNLRKRLASYRVANPERLARRHLRLLRAVDRIELQECADEASALAREAELLLSLRPRFNRAGTWPGVPRFVAWALTGEGLALTITQTPEPSMPCFGPLGASSVPLRAALLRLLWCAVHPERGFLQLPLGWFSGQHGETATLPRLAAPGVALEDAAHRLAELFRGQAQAFADWIGRRPPAHPFEQAARDADLETVRDLVMPKSAVRSDPGLLSGVSGVSGTEAF